MTWVGKEIWENNKENNGPCADCPNRDKNGYFVPRHYSETGYFGGSNPDILFVADSPRMTHPGTNTNRRLRDSPNDDEYENKFDESYEKNSKSTIDWFFSQIPENFFENIGYDDSVVDYETGFHPDGNLRFTNSKKCGDIHPKGQNRVENHTAKYNCRNYYRKELELLDPQIVVTMGNNAFRETIAVLDMNVDDISSSMAKNIRSKEGRFAHYGENQYLIPVYHFSATNRNYWRLRADEEDKEEFQTQDYWRALSEKIRNLLDK